MITASPGEFSGFVLLQTKLKVPESLFEKVKVSISFINTKNNILNKMHLLSSHIPYTSCFAFRWFPNPSIHYNESLYRIVLMVRKQELQCDFLFKTFLITDWCFVTSVAVCGYWNFFFSDTNRILREDVWRGKARWCHDQD